MDALTKEVKHIISNILPDKFGLMIDGWSEGKQHFFATFACFPENEKRRTLLPGFSPPLQDDDLSALSLKALIEDTLAIFNKKLDSVIFY